MSDLRRTLEETRRELERTRDDVERLRAVDATLPSSTVIAAREREARARRAATVLTTMTIALSLGASYGLVKWLARTPEPVVVSRGPTEAAKLREELDGVREYLSTGRSRLAVARIASVPTLPAAELSRSYPALDAIVRRSETDAGLRWANVAIAACTVHEVGLARWALGALFSGAARSVVARSQDPRAARPSDDARLAIAAVRMECKARGHSLE
jgi:hypothetical protein